MPITVERVDFISVPTRDSERAREFYLRTLGLPLDRDTPAGFEVTAGQVTLGIWEPERMGRPFQPMATCPGGFDSLAESRGSGIGSPTGDALASCRHFNSTEVERDLGSLGFDGGSIGATDRSVGDSVGANTEVRQAVRLLPPVLVETSILHS